MQKGWRIAIAVASLGLAAVAFVALFTPLVVTEITYSAWGLEYEASGALGFSNPAGGAPYDDPAFDDSAEGNWLRAVAPLLIATVVLGLLAGLGALFPRVAGVLVSGILGLLAALAGAAAIIAVWQGSDFADGANSLGDLAIGSWLVGGFVLVTVLTVAAAWLVSSVVGVARATSRPATTDAVKAASLAPPAPLAALRPRTPRPAATLHGRSSLVAVTLLGAAAVLAIPAMLVRLATAGDYRYHAFGHHHMSSSNWRHGGADAVTLMVGGIWLAIGVVAAVALVIMYGWWRAGHEAPARGAWVLVHAAAGVGLIMGALVLGTGLQMLRASEEASVGVGTAWAISIGLLGLAAYVPAWLAAFSQTTSAKTA